MLSETNADIVTAISMKNSVSLENNETRKYVENSKICFESFGDPHDVLWMLNYKENQNQDNDKVLVKVEATTVTALDCLIRKRLFYTNISLPYTPGCDLVGRVIQCGTGANEYDIREDDFVAAMGLNLGGNARYVSVPAHQLVKIPEDLDLIETVCMLRPYLTAYQCLHRAENRPIKVGNRVLVVGGSGTVGQAVIRLANSAGASIVYVTAHPKHHSLIQSLNGVRLDLNSDDWNSRIKGSMDIVVDCISSDRSEYTISALKPTGKLVCVGASLELGGLALCMEGFGSLDSLCQADFYMNETKFFDVFDFNEKNLEAFHDDLAFLFSMLRKRKIETVVSSCIDLDGIANSHALIENGSVCGTIICLPFGCAGKTCDKKIQLGISQIQEDRSDKQEWADTSPRDAGIERGGEAFDKLSRSSSQKSVEHVTRMVTPVNNDAKNREKKTVEKHGDSPVSFSLEETERRGNYSMSRKKVEHEPGK